MGIDYNVKEKKEMRKREVHGGIGKEIGKEGILIGLKIKKYFSNNYKSRIK